MIVVFTAVKPVVMSDDRAADQVNSEGDGVKQVHPESDFLLEEVVYVSGAEKRLTLKHDGLVLGSQDTGGSAKKNKDLCLTWRDVISAIKDTKSKSGRQLDSFTLYYINHQGNYTLEVKHVQITVREGEMDKWISAINEKCTKVTGRPKKAFVIINPIGGSKTALKTYHKKVAPVFELARIHTTVKVTERLKHAVELAENLDLSAYDAVVVVGGDGFYQEVLLGVTLRVQKDAEIDYNNPEAVFMKPKIPFGIIPAGTGNGMARYCNGTVDEVTTALNIIRGENHKAQVLTVHSCGKFVSVCGSFFGYGEFSDLMKRSDELRWMGRLRYPYSLVGMLFKKPRMFNCVIEYRKVDNDETPNLSHSSSEAGAQRSEWIVYTGNSGNVCGILCSTCEHSMNDRILNPFGSSIDLLIDFGTGRVNLLKTMFVFTAAKNASEPLSEKLDFISRITGFRIRLNSDATDDENLSAERVRDRELECLLDIDGEVVQVNKPDIDVRVRSEFVSLYGLKISGNSKDQKSNSSGPQLPND